MAPLRLAILSPAQLEDPSIRHHFLIQVFAFAELRELGENPTRTALADFQRRHKHVLMTYDQHKMRALGSIAATADSIGAKTAYKDYARTFREALSKPPTHEAWANGAQHMYGHFKAMIPAQEKVEFLSILTQYRAQKLPLEAALTMIRMWCARYTYHYFADQTLLEPYPRGLTI